MTIHHATIKRAAEKGITITAYDDDADFANAKAEGTTLDLTSDDAKALVDIAIFAKMMLVEYPGLTIEQADPEDEALTYLFGGEEIGEGTLSDIEETLQEALSEMTDEQRDAAEQALEDEAEQEDKGTVVPDKYKQRYAEAGHPDNCGDWLAVTLASLCHVTDGKKDRFSVEKMELLNQANGVDSAKYMVNQTRGWEGRYRMTTRNMLAKKIAGAGVMMVPGEVDGQGDRELKAPAEWCARFAPKVKEANGKKAAAEKSA
jgi:hypothetical protein